MQRLENKKIKRLLGIMIIIPLLLCLSCTEEQLSPGDNNSEVVRLSMNLSAKSGIIDSEVSKLRIIAFDSFNGTLKYNGLVDLTNGTIQILSGMSDFYAIVNEPASKSADLNSIALLSDLEAINIPTNEMVQGDSYVMQGSILKQNIKTGVVTNSVTITVHRLAVKINLTVWGVSLSKPTEINFTGLPTTVPLLELSSEPSTDGKVTVNGLTETGNIPSGYLWEQKANDIVLPSFLFNPSNDKNKAAQIEVKINSKVTKAVIGHAIKVENDPKDYTLHRNTVYSLKAVTAGDNLTIENVSIENWVSKDEQFPVGGGVWKIQPEKQWKVIGEKAIFTAQFTSRTDVSYKWYRKRQTNASSFIVEEISSGEKTDPNTKTSTLEITPAGLDEAGLIYCVATTISSDGAEENIESSAVTFMVVGNWTSTDSEFDIMQNWKAPKNVPLGATCLLRDDRDDKIYRVKLLADGNWWMIQDLAFGNVVDEATFAAHCDDKDYTGSIATDAYGVATETGKGHNYNVFAALQMAVDPDDASKSNGANYEFIKGLCPDGWHLPGNMDMEFNKEWILFCSELELDLTSVDGITRYEYNAPKDFNAYTYVNFASNAICFHGGYMVDRENRFKPIDYRILGPFIPDIGLSDNFMDAFISNLQIPVRCVRDFK